MLAAPVASVVAVAKPRKFWPCAYPDGLSDVLVAVPVKMIRPEPPVPDESGWFRQLAGSDTDPTQPVRNRRGWVPLGPLLDLTDEHA
jgi:hypothetical protein